MTRRIGRPPHPTPIFKTAGAAIKAPVTDAKPTAATPMQRIEFIPVGASLIRVQ
jgi:hypothetical protein